MFSKIRNCMLSKAKAFKKGGSTSCLCITTILCLVPLVTLAFVLKYKMPNSETYIIYIDTQDEALFTVNERFLSLGLDSTVITEGFKHFNMSDPKLILMLKYLSPAYLRVGGTEADRILFESDQESDLYVLKSEDWVRLNNFVNDANVKMIYDLNSLLRFENGSWNPENAINLLEFSEKSGFDVDWELGNEPNIYRHKFDVEVNATQLGTDFKTLRTILNSFSNYVNSSLIGPSTTRLRTKEIEDYFYEFLKSGSEALGAITFHHYYFSGMNATWSQFLDAANFDYLQYCVDTVISVLRLLPNLNAPLWIGETSTAWHGGAPGMSDRFLASFLWIDKLGLSAKMGIEVVVRQSFFKGDYALINNTYYPNPDWWLSVIYKKLVGPKVITTETEGNANVRLYAHCARENSLWNQSQAVVVFGVNLSEEKGLVQVKELRSDSTVFQYELVADGSLFSQFVRLNGKTLRLAEDLKLPEMRPTKIERQDIMTLQAYSIVFWVFTNTNLEACQ